MVRRTSHREVEKMFDTKPFTKRQISKARNGKGSLHKYVINMMKGGKVFEPNFVEEIKKIHNHLRR